MLMLEDRCTLLGGDALALLQTLPDASVDAVVTDPPAGIGFMAKAWDGDKGGRDAWIAWLRTIMVEVLRVLKPGAHALVWALPRTSHWTATAIEDAGFEIRDVGIHLFGTGFPKSLTSKSADIPEDTGTALKPAAEHWILARKPLDGSVAENYARWGVGILNIGECRIGHAEPVKITARTAPRYSGVSMNGGNVGGKQSVVASADPAGRWPAHVTLDEEAAAALGEPARFFYVAKGSRAEKDAGLEHLKPRTALDTVGRDPDSAGAHNPRAGAGRGAGAPIYTCRLCALNLQGGRAATTCESAADGKHVREQTGTGTGARNFHPTVKSVDLMRWLVRLVTPRGGVVLDPFAGSGTTGVAALAEGASFIGFELGGEDGEYWPILVGRLAHALAK